MPMPIFCNTHTTVEKHCFTVMKKCISRHSAQTFTWSLRSSITTAHRLPWFVHRQPATHLPRKNLQVNVTSWSRLFEAIAEWSEYCALLDAVKGLHVMKNSTENLHWLIRDKVATWVSEHIMQQTSIAACMSKYHQHTAYWRNFADMILW